MTTDSNHPAEVGDAVALAVQAFGDVLVAIDAALGESGHEDDEVTTLRRARLLAARSAAHEALAWTASSMDDPRSDDDEVAGFGLAIRSLPNFELVKPPTLHRFTRLTPTRSSLAPEANSGCSNSACNDTCPDCPQDY